MPLEKVRKVLKIAKEPISLETPIGDEEDSHLGDFIEDKNAVIPVDAAIQSNLKETVTRVLASLTPREERVLRMRFGIGMNTDHTLEEVGQQFSVTRERIRQIEAKALRKLKHPSAAGRCGPSWTNSSQGFSAVRRMALRMCRAQPVRGTGEHGTKASEPFAEDAELPGSIIEPPSAATPTRSVAGAASK